MILLLSFFSLRLRACHIIYDFSWRHAATDVFAALLMLLRAILLYAILFSMPLLLRRH